MVAQTHDGCADTHAYETTTHEQYHFVIIVIAETLGNAIKAIKTTPPESVQSKSNHDSTTAI